MGVSKNSGTPKSSILIGFSIINHPFWGTIIFGNTHISQALQLDEITASRFTKIHFAFVGFCRVAPSYVMFRYFVRTSVSEKVNIKISTKPSHHINLFQTYHIVFHDF